MQSYVKDLSVILAVDWCVRRPPPGPQQSPARARSPAGAPAARRRRPRTAPAPRAHFAPWRPARLGGASACPGSSPPAAVVVLAMLLRAACGGPYCLGGRPPDARRAARAQAAGHVPHGDQHLGRLLRGDGRRGVGQAL